MRYLNATEVLPEALLKEVQKYASGEALYIPRQNTRKKWGEGSGARSFYEERNCKIRQQFEAGSKLEDLAEKYSLSVDTIRKILYK